MKVKVEARNRARQLRMQGYSYREIKELMPDVAKSTLSVWLRSVELSAEQEERLLVKMRLAGMSGRQKGALANRQARMRRIEKAKSEARASFSQLMKDPLFPVGVVLYQAEGGKASETFQFINSDSRLIILIIRWLTQTLQIDSSRLKVRIYIHRIYEDQNCLEYWSKVTGLPMNQFSGITFKPTPHKVKKNPGYMGCCRITVGGMHLFWQIQTWQQLLFEYY